MRDLTEQQNNVCDPEETAWNKYRYYIIKYVGYT